MFQKNYPITKFASSAVVFANSHTPTCILTEKVSKVNFGFTAVLVDRVIKNATHAFCSASSIAPAYNLR